ncbi:MAG: type II toxin-antitoxin system PemK/MazF family toxin [Candidatus Obscuribacterales bacterium]|nr:type II toxin-antitoxin system PemK/MazF family toxin [Candidatus Obscuribacterales bacterium]
MIEQGDLFWLNLAKPTGSEPGFRRPVVVVQNGMFNRSKIRTAVVCALTTNMSLGEAPGNVRLNKGEAGLKQESVVNVSQIFTVDRSHLKEKIGTISPRRVVEIIKGIELVIRPAL